MHSYVARHSCGNPLLVCVWYMGWLDLCSQLSFLCLQLVENRVFQLLLSIICQLLSSRTTLLHCCCQLRFPSCILGVERAILHHHLACEGTVRAVQCIVVNSAYLSHISARAIECIVVNLICLSHMSAKAVQWLLSNLGCLLHRWHRGGGGVTPSTLTCCQYIAWAVLWFFSTWPAFHTSLPGLYSALL